MVQINIGVFLFLYPASTQLMTESNRDQIEENRPNIIKYLHLEERILSKLQAQKVLTSSMAAQLRCLPVDDQKNSLFLENVIRLSRNQLETLIQILSEENQEHVAELFRHNTGRFRRHTNIRVTGRSPLNYCQIPFYQSVHKLFIINCTIFFVLLFCQGICRSIKQLNFSLLIYYILLNLQAEQADVKQASILAGEIRQLALSDKEEENLCDPIRPITRETG